MSKPSASTPVQGNGWTLSKQATGVAAAVFGQPVGNITRKALRQRVATKLGLARSLLDSARDLRHERIAVGK